MLLELVGIRVRAGNGTRNGCAMRGLVQFIAKQWSAGNLTPADNLTPNRAGRGTVELPRFDGHSEKRESTRGGVDDGEGTEAEEVLG